MTVKTELPAEFSSLFAKPALISIVNSKTTQAAVTADKGKHFVRSQLTVSVGKDT